MLLVGLTVLGPLSGAKRGPEPLPHLESGLVSFVTGSGSTPIGYALTALGPMVALQPIVARLGGELALGPMLQSHELTLGDKTFVFGPDSSFVASGEELSPISQRPEAAAAGLLVPVDLLDTVYGEQSGYQFDWQRESRTLTVTQLPSREMPVSVDVVHLQGVTTVVLQFPMRPRYRVEHKENAVEVRLVGDRLVPTQPRRMPEGRLVTDLRMRPEGVRLDLVPGTQAREYILRDPFRLVFDIYRDTGGQSVAVTSPQQARRSPGIRVIAIDPGHGGSDTGAIGPSGVAEKDLTLVLARTLKNRLERRLPVKIVLTRGTDADLPLETRTAVANQRKADLFISLHLNAGHDPGSTGAETYFMSLEASDEAAARAAEEENLVDSGNGDALYDLQLILWDMAQSHHLAESQAFARVVQEELNQALGLRNRGVKQAPFKVLIGAAMPAVLVELGFLSNPEEEERLQDPAYQEQLVDSLVRSISRYKNRVERTGAPAEETVP